SGGGPGDLMQEDYDNSGWPPAGMASAGMSGAGGGTHVVVVVPEPCWVAGCEEGEVCDGVSCVGRPATCRTGGEPACGVDGRTYASVCEANRLGVDVTPRQSECPSPKGYFLCDESFCDLATSFCNDPLDREERSQTPPEDLGCLPLPPECVDDH